MIIVMIQANTLTQVVFIMALVFVHEVVEVVVVS